MTVGEFKDTMGRLTAEQQEVLVRMFGRNAIKTLKVQKGRDQLTTIFIEWTKSDSASVVTLTPTGAVTGHNRVETGTLNFVAYKEGWL